MSSRSGLVESIATGASISSSMRRMYFTAVAGRSAHERAPRVLSCQPSKVSVDRAHQRLVRRRRRDVVEYRAVAAVAGAHLELRHAVEHVELGERDPLDAADLDRLAHQHGVEPAAAPAAAGHGAELTAALAEPAAGLVVELGGERPAAHARRIGLGDAEHIADGPRPDARAGAAWPASVLDEVTKG